MFCSKIKLKEIEMKKKAILDEAKKIIAKVGFKNAKMKDIAEKVGFSKASLYSYFKDKEEIAMNLFKEHLEKNYEKVKDLPDQNLSALEKFKKLREIHLEFINSGKNLIIIRPDIKNPKPVHLEVFELKIKMFGVLKHILEQGKIENTFNKNLDIENTMLILDSLVTGIIFQSTMHKNVKSDFIRPFDMEEMIDKALDFFVMAITNKNLEQIKK